MDKRSLLVSLDNVICFPGYLDTINEFMNTNYVIGDFTEYYMDEESVPDNQYKDFIKFLNSKNLYQNAQLLKNAKEVLESLDIFYDLYIYTSYINSMNQNLSQKTFKEKYEYLVSTLPFISPEKFIFTDRTEIFQSDIQIDDRIASLKNTKNTKYKLLFPAYHNKKIPDQYLSKLNIIRAGYDWEEGWETIGDILLPEDAKQYIYK